MDVRVGMCGLGGAGVVGVEKVDPAFFLAVVLGLADCGIFGFVIVIVLVFVAEVDGVGVFVAVAFACGILCR